RRNAIGSSATSAGGGFARDQTSIPRCHQGSRHAPLASSLRFGRGTFTDDSMVPELLQREPRSSIQVSCRSCGQVGLTTILSLGHTPLANRLLSKSQLDESEPLWPL